MTRLICTVLVLSNTCTLKFWCPSVIQSIKSKSSGINKHNPFSRLQETGDNYIAKILSWLPRSAANYSFLTFSSHKQAVAETYFY